MMTKLDDALQELRKAIAILEKEREEMRGLLQSWLEAFPKGSGDVEGLVKWTKIALALVPEREEDEIDTPAQGRMEGMQP